MSQSLSSLTFGNLDSSAEDLLSKYSAESAEINYPFISEEGLALESRLVNYIKDFSLVNEVIQSIQKRKGVCKQDILTLESLRPHYPELDRLMTINPISMYTTESSPCMYQESLEGFIQTAVNAVGQWLNGFLKWIWELIRRTHERLMVSWTNTRKCEAKFDAIEAMRGYITSVGRALSNVPEGEAVVRRISDERLQDFNRNIRENELAYLKKFTEYDVIVDAVTYLLSNQLGAMIADTNALINALSKVKTVDDTLEIELTFKEVLQKRTNSQFTLTAIGDIDSVKFLLKTKTDIRPTVEGLVTLLSLLPTNPANNAKAQAHPVFFQSLSSKTLPYLKYNDNVKKFVEVESVALVKRCRDLISKPIVFETALVQQNTELVGLIGRYRSTLIHYEQLVNAVINIVELRSQVIDKVAKSLLAEVKAIDKWISSNPNLPLEVIGVRGHHQKLVAKAISTARL